MFKRIVDHYNKKRKAKLTAALEYLSNRGYDPNFNYIVSEDGRSWCYNERYEEISRYKKAAMFE